MKTIEVNHTNLISCKIPNHVIALGFFDGLHKGHKRVILRAKEEAEKQNLPLAVMSFFPHPKSVLSKGKANVEYLMPLDEKQKQLEAMGVDYFFIVEFTLDFASLSPKTFIQNYVIGLGAVHVVCGYDYTYGSKGAGDVTTLYKHGDGNLNVSIVPKVEMYGEKISSTRIRELLRQGDMRLIEKLLGKPYEVKWSQREGLRPYYTLPTPGFYNVTITSRSSKQKAVVEVVNMSEIRFEEPITEDCKIEWHSKMDEKKYYVS